MSSQLIEEARKTRDMYTLLGLASPKKWMVCPLPEHEHANYTPSFSIFWKDGHQRFKCHGNCGATGDVVDLVGFLNIPNYQRRNPEHVRRALEYLEIHQPFAPPVKPPPSPKLLPWAWQQFTPPGVVARNYAHARGLTDATIEKFHLGEDDGYLTIPCFQDGLLWGIKKRHCTDAGRGLRFYQVDGSRGGLFNHDAVVDQPEPVLIVNGEIAAMILDQAGFLACAHTGGEHADFSAYVEKLIFAEKIVIVADNDPAPTTAEKISKKAFSRAGLLHADVRRPPAGVKDVDQWILASGQAAVEEIRSWL